MLRLINKLKNRKGFTLIELIVVLAVLAIIMAIAVPRFMGVQDEAEDKADISTFQMMLKSAELYFAQNPTDSSVTVSELQTEGLLGEAKFNNSITVTSFSIDSDGIISASASGITYDEDDGTVELP